MLKKMFIAVIVLMLSAGSVQAANLSSSDIERFIGAYKELIPYFDDLDDDLGDFDDGKTFDVQTLKQGFMEAFAENRNLENIVKKHGYSSSEQFADKGAHIIRAYIGYASKDGFNELEQALAQMSPEERQFMESSPFFEMMEQTKAQIQVIPEQHIKAIEPYIPQLNELFDSFDDDDDYGY